jgi:Flp pilus assembly protein TadG
MIASAIFQRLYRFWGKKRPRTRLFRRACPFVGYVFQGTGVRPAPFPYVAHIAKFDIQPAVAGFSAAEDTRSQLMRGFRTIECRTAQSRPDRRATACVEFALVLPVLLIFVLGLLEMGRYIEVRQILTSAAEEGARQASTGQVTNAQVINVVKGCVAATGLPTTNLTVTVADLSSPGTDVSAATTMDNIQVTVTIPFSNVRWCSSLLVTNSSTLVDATVYWVSAVPQAYPDTVTAPTGS